MAGVLLIAQSASDCGPLAGFAQAYSMPFDLLCLQGEEAKGYGADRVLSANLEELPSADALCDGLAEISRSYAVVAGLASMFGKDYLPRLAAVLDRPMAGDVMKVHDAKTFSRPMYAGNITARVAVDAEAFIVSVRGTAFQTPQTSGQSPREVFTIAGNGSATRTGVAEATGGRPDLTQARVVVSGGRPLRDAETFERLIGGLADALGGATGATRAAVDGGIAPNETQVGQTGKIVAPELYVAAGVSGSTQHLAGMKDSKIIVAINTDPSAPIYEIADFGLVQDLHTALPELIEKLKH